MREPRQTLAKVCFWASASVVAYFYVGFPVTAVLRGRLFKRPVRRGPILPRVSLIITAHNEERLIEEKLTNALAVEYPPDRLEILVASDGSTDRTNELAATFVDHGVRLLELPRLGKNAAMSAAAEEASGEILVFNDADTAVTRESVRALVSPFADPEVGAVAGERRHREPSEWPVAARLRRTISRRIQRALSEGGSVTTAGLLYAVRREHFRPVPANVVDDLYIPAQVVMDHRRFVFEPAAATYPLGPSREIRDPFARTVRMDVQLLRTYLPLARLFNPALYGFFSIQLLCQKVLRRFMVIPLAALLGSGIALWRHGQVYRLGVSLNLGLHGLALIGVMLRAAGHRQIPVVRGAFRFDRDLLAGAAALGALLVHRDVDRWETHRRP